jgi:hypothetical protein
MESRRNAKIEFADRKAEQRVSTPYGMQYSPHYLKQSRRQSEK